jgi:hypothetical protein
VKQALRTSIEIGGSSVRSMKLRKAIHASDIFWWPVNSPVSMITRRSMRSASSTAVRSPIGPPQSCTTTVAPRRSRRSKKSFSASVWRS